MARTEQNFEYRIKRLLESRGYLVLNVARSKPFDLVAMKNMVPFVIELKGKTTTHPTKQKSEQLELCRKTGNAYIIIRQSKKKGKIIIEQGYPPEASWIKSRIERDLERWVEIPGVFSGAASATRPMFSGRLKPSDEPETSLKREGPKPFPLSGIKP